MPDPVPILALGAAVAWVSLVTVEFYERIYRERIEKYAPELRALGDARFNKIVGYLREGETGLDSFISDVNSLKNAEKELMDARKIPLVFLLLSSLSSIVSSYSPTFDIFGIPLMLITYLLLFGVFVTGFWFLWKMLWFDEQIPKARDILQAEKKAPGTTPTA